MPKQKTYTGTKKGQSMARQGRRNKTMGRGGNPTALQNSEEKPKNAFIQPGAGKRLVSNIIINLIVLAGLAIVLVVTGKTGTPDSINIPVVVGCAVLMVLLILWDIWRKKKNGTGAGKGLFG